MRYYNNLLIPGALQTAGLRRGGLRQLPAAVGSGIRSRRVSHSASVDASGCCVRVGRSISRFSTSRCCPATVASLSVMRGQLEQLRDMTAEGRDPAQAHSAHGGGLSSRSDRSCWPTLRRGRSVLLYRETADGDEIIHDLLAVEGHRRRFDQMWSAALDQDNSLRRITDRIAELST